MKISVIICSHNPREDYLRRVLEALKMQTLPKDEWELLLVDNASREPLASNWDLSWHPHARHLREDRVGLTHARLCGIAAAQGDLLVFVDDDNVLRADYLQAALKVSADYPRLGAWGGSCIPEFEVEPPVELWPWMAGLVIEKITASVWGKLRHGSKACPSGAGITVRRQQAEHYRELVLHDPMRRALDRSGKSLGGGGDTDMALCGVDINFGTGRFPELELTHLIPAQRLTLEYLQGIHEGFGYANVVLEAIYEANMFPGKIQVSGLRIFLLRILMFVSGKGRAERRIRLALERGRLQARRDLDRKGYSKSTGKQQSPA